jgi:hypothetical protein
MSISRRKFLKAGTIVALSVGLPLKATLTAMGQKVSKELDGNPFDNPLPEIPYDPLSYYTKSAFTAYLNSTFRVGTGNLETVEVTLTRVTDLLPDTSANVDGRECFSLAFRGGSVSLPQNTYAIDHDALGSFQLFLVPGGRLDNGEQAYVAIVNRLAKSPALLSAPIRWDRGAAKQVDQPSRPPANASPASPQISPRKGRKEIDDDAVSTIRIVQ